MIEEKQKLVSEQVKSMASLPKIKKDTNGEFKAMESNVLIKELTLLFITIVIGIFGWWLYGAILVGSLLSMLSLVAILIIVFCLHLALASWTVFFSRRAAWVIASIVISLIPWLIRFSSEYIIIISIGFVLYSLSFVWMRVRMRYAARNQINFSLVGMFRGGISIVVYAFLLNVSILYFVDFSANDSVSQNIQQSAIKYSASGIDFVFNRVDGYSSEMTVDEFIFWYGKSGLLGTDADTSIIQEKALPKELENILGNIIKANNGSSIIEEQQALIKREFLTALGLNEKNLSSKATVHEVWEAFVSNKIKPYLNLYKQFIPWVMALGLFFSLIIFVILYKWIIYIFAWAVMKLLQTAKIITLKEEKVTVKRLSF